MSKIKKAVAVFKEYGFKRSLGMVKNKIQTSPGIQNKKARKLVRNSLKYPFIKKNNNDIKVSILMPVFNTDIDMLKCVIESVINQTYQNIELCIFDASDELHKEASDLCYSYSTMDARILYKKGENQGISANTNQCIKLATGNYFGLLDHDDILHGRAVEKVVSEIEKNNADFVYTDELTFSGKITNILSTNFKPDYSPETLRCNNYICHFVVFSRTLFERTGEFNPSYDGSQDHEMFLRLTDRAEKVIHIPEILYFWRAHKGSVVEDINAKKYAIDAGIKGVTSFLKSKGIEAQVGSSEVYPTIYRIKYAIKNSHKVSIVILNNNHLSDIKKCVDSLLGCTYKNVEIIILENNSTDEKLFEYYENIKKDDRIKIVTCNKAFNYSEFNNVAVKESKGEYLLFMNNDMEVINPEFIEEMLMLAIQPNSGAVGARLFYPDNTLQHCYVITGTGVDRVAAHAGLGIAKNDYGYLDRIGFVQNVNAVTGACLMVSRRIFDEVGGFDEAFPVAYNDVDLCLKIRTKGYYNLYTPYATLYHYESATRGNDNKGDKKKRLNLDAENMKIKWGDNIKDPYYNPNFSAEKLYFIK